MTPDQLLAHATRFVFGNTVCVNMYADMPDHEKRWRVYRMRDVMKFGDCIGKDLTREAACELAMREGL